MHTCMHLFYAKANERSCSFIREDILTTGWIHKKYQKIKYYSSTPKNVFVQRTQC